MAKAEWQTCRRFGKSIDDRRRKLTMTFVSGEGCEPEKANGSEAV